MLDKEQLDQLSQELNEDDDYEDLESMIRDGVNAVYPIIIEFPNGKKSRALIKPISSNQLQSCLRRSQKGKEDIISLVCEKCLLTPQEKPVDNKLLKLIPAGVMKDILDEILRVSGVKRDPQAEKELTKQLSLF